MNTVRFHQGKSRVIAHRGLSSLERENTHAAFVAAGNRSYFGIETDLHVTGDGIFVLHHDDVTDGFISIEKNDYSKIETIILKDLDGKYRNDLVIPLLPEYISICKKYDKTAVLELKNKIKKEEIEKIIRMIKEKKYLEKTIIISFDWDNLVAVRELLPNQPLQYLLRDWEDGYLEKLAKYHIDLDVHERAVTPQLVQRLHQKGLLINCWTCDEKERAEELVSYGVDFITTNRLEGE